MTRPLTEPPGGVLMWLIVALELVTFAMVFTLIGVLRMQQPALFHAGQAALSSTVGLVFTLLLITSGLLAAEAVHAYRLTRTHRAQRFLFAAIALGLAFVAFKLHDTAGHLAAGHRLGGDDFWDAYFLGTGFHLAHVLVGLVLLSVVAFRLHRARPPELETVAAVALFWHLCDLAWFFLFPLFFARA